MPKSKFNILWRTVLFLLLFWTAIYIPIRVAFINHIADWRIALEVFVDIFFLCDVILMFFIPLHRDDGF